jgi:hypothetical protein
MSTAIATIDGLSFVPFDVDGTKGYTVVNKSDGRAYSVSIGIDADGKVFAEESAYAQGGDVQTVTKLDPKAAGHWAYSLMTGTPSESLLDKLSVSHATRAQKSPALFATLAGCAERYLPGLNKDALAVLARAPEKRLSTYEFYAGETERHLFRRQAAEAYPLFADLFSANITLKMAIDRKKPLKDVLLPILKEMAEQPVADALLKRLRTATPMPEGYRLSTIIKFASSVQPDWFPKTDEDWQAFYHVAVGVIEDLRLDHAAIPTVLAGSGGKWQALVERSIQKAFPEDDHPLRQTPYAALRTATTDTNDMVETFTDMVVVPVVAHSQSAEDVYLNASIKKSAIGWAWNMLCEGRNLPDILDLSRRFHQERNGILEMSTQWQAQQARAQVKEGGWPGLTSPVQAPNGLWLVPLCHPEELSKEGADLRHCVGGYSSQAKACTSHIVSVRQQRGNESVALSTCEFSGIKSDRPVLAERQHRARQNGQPQPDALDAMQWYERGIASGDIKVNWELIRAFLDNALVDMDHVEKHCGYDWRERQALNGAIMPWARFVTKSYAKMNLNQLLDHESAQAIVAQMTPAFLSANDMQ